MDLDLAEYDQVDEARFFVNQQLQIGQSPLIVTMSTSIEPSSSGDELNCENDFVFLPSGPTESIQQQQTLKINATIQDGGKQQKQGSGEIQKASSSLPPSVRHPTSLSLRNKRESEAKSSNSLPKQAAANTRTSHPLMTISRNAASGKNPFYNLNKISPDSASSHAYQPFWMRPESFASKPIGLLEINTSNSCSPGQMSDLMHQIVTKSDSIYIAIPCAYCHEPKACPPSDISSWLNHMNRAHNCKVCPICNKLVGLGPMRDLEIMKKHVISHIDDEWLERRSVKTNFSFGLQQQWFSGARCSVKDPRSLNSGIRK